MLSIIKFAKFQRIFLIYDVDSSHLYTFTIWFYTRVQYVIMHISADLIDFLVYIFHIYLLFTISLEFFSDFTIFFVIIILYT